MLTIFLDKLYFLWNAEDIEFLIDFLYRIEYLDCLTVLLKSKAFTQIIHSMSFED